jgi:broad specificity phosphatase PhoE
MDKVCKIILVRHGESVNNKQRVIGGNSPLTGAGREQAKITKQDLKKFKFDEVYSSDLERAVETATIIAGQPVPKDHRLSGLRERHYGMLEGKSQNHLDEEHERRVNMTHQENWVYKHVEDTESDHELSSRFIRALTTVAEANPGKTVLVAAHGAAIRTTLMDLKGMTYHDIPNQSFKNAGFVELDYQDDRFEVVQIVGHQI